MHAGREKRKAGLDPPLFECEEEEDKGAASVEAAASMSVAWSLSSMFMDESAGCAAEETLEVEGPSVVSMADETAATSSEPSSSLPCDADEATAAGGEEEDFFEGAAASDGFKRGGESSSSVPDCSPPCALLTLRRFDEDPGAEADAGGEAFGDGDGFR